MLEPEKGSVTLQSGSGESFSMNCDLRRFFAYVPQGNTLFSGTIAENMRMVNEKASDDEIIRALKIACAWDFVQNLPEGINSVLGEHGRGLSEGQAQRISIARAVLRRSPILLLDEATSALDSDTEKKVLYNLMKSHPDRLIILSTHRPAALKYCTRIYRIAENKITEISHEQAQNIQECIENDQSKHRQNNYPVFLSKPMELSASDPMKNKTEEGWWNN